VRQVLIPANLHSPKNCCIARIVVLQGWLTINSKQDYQLHVMMIKTLLCGETNIACSVVSFQSAHTPIATVGVRKKAKGLRETFGAKKVRMKVWLVVWGRA
jgi:hypothetical protein